VASDTSALIDRVVSRALGHAARGLGLTVSRGTDGSLTYTPSHPRATALSSSGAGPGGGRMPIVAPPRPGGGRTVGMRPEIGGGGGGGGGGTTTPPPTIPRAPIVPVPPRPPLPPPVPFHGPGACPAGTVLLPSGVCGPPTGGTCPPGTKLAANGACVPTDYSPCPPGTHPGPGGQCVADPPGPPPGGPPGGGGGPGPEPVTHPGLSPGASSFGETKFPLWVYSGGSGNTPVTAPYGLDPGKDWNKIYGFTTAPNVPDSSGLCPPGSFPSSDGKTCETGTPPPVGTTCPKGWSYDANSATCHQDAPPGPGNCPSGQKWNATTKACEDIVDSHGCAPGERWDPVSQSCVPKGKGPPGATAPSVGAAAQAVAAGKVPGVEDTGGSFSTFDNVVDSASKNPFFT